MLELISFGEKGYGWLLVQGAWVTLQLSFVGFAAALVLGVLIAMATLERRGLRWAVWRVYASVFMGVPSLLVIFLLFFGGAEIVRGLLAPFGINAKLDMTPFTAGAVGLAIVYSAYMAELVRGAIQNVPKGQFESAAALCIPRVHIWTKVILPQAARLALPGLVNLWIILLKDTALVSLVGLNDIIAQAKIAAGSTKQPFVFYTAAAVFFIIFGAVTVRYSRYLRERLERGQRTAQS